MAVGANTYGTVAGVERLIGDIVASRTFGSGTSPTLTQCEAQLDAIAADLNRELEVVGYTVPVATADATAKAFLAEANNQGAAATPLGSMPRVAVNPDDPEAADNRANMLYRQYQHAIKMIREQRLAAGRATGRFARVFAGGQQNSDGETNLPPFTRDLHDYPGLRSLTE